MIAHHSALARRLGEELGLTGRRLDAVDASYEQWDGKGWPGELRGDDGAARRPARRHRRVHEVPTACRRCRSGDRAGGKQRGKQFDPQLADVFANTRCDLRRTSTRRHLGGGDRRRAIPRGPALWRAVRRRAARHSRLHRPQVTLHPRPRPRGRRACRRRRRRSSGCRRRDPHAHRAALVHGFGRLGVSNAIWTSRGRSAPASGNACGCSRISPSGCCVSRRSSLRSRARGAAPRALDGSGYPQGLSGPRSLARRGFSARPTRISRCANPVPIVGLSRRSRPQLSCATEVQAGRFDVRRGRGRARRSRAPRAADDGRTGRAHGPRDRRAAAARPRLTNKEIAERLVISPKTAGNHVEHIYTKIDVSTRTAAGLSPRSRAPRRRGTRVGVTVRPSGAPPCCAGSPRPALRGFCPPE